ncbi:tetratricopeptide repeat protein [Actinoplanes xinjiangensis]|uniref:Tetratricopeptide repeat-containing protein n=1 Tax=Actinoplanes xinjiangensis TaxID=512350 RepID=A0A316FX55_9ACTN|nr:tetratricopeptide repeat protein [Actinoplanes xinjiangensis]PWK46657.1 Tetratricopeptide repeat-containing protein [Actinoplanes xinjiangensis]
MPAPLEPDTTPEEYRQRALLLADLGRYDEAADEIAAGLTAEPLEVNLLATLARIHLIAEQPTEALAAADRAVTADPKALPALVVRAMALVDIRRYAEAARIAGEILRDWPEDPYAQRTGAALLSESRNGQEALNAAWNGVRVAPTEAEAHLVLAVVAARLRLFDLAQRAYGEALDLDSTIGDAGRETGIVRFERRRWARAIEDLAEEASLSGPQAPPIPPSPETPAAPKSDGSVPPSPAPQSPEAPRSPDAPSSPEGPSSPKAQPSPAAPPPPSVSLPSRPVLDISEESAAAVRETVGYGAGGVVVAAVLTSAMTLISAGISRVWAGLIGVLVFGAVVFWFRSRLPEPAGVVLRRLRGSDRKLAVAVYLAFAAPLFLLAYAVVGGPVPLVAGMLTAAVAEVLMLIRRRP